MVIQVNEDEYPETSPLDQAHYEADYPAPATLHYDEVRSSYPSSIWRLRRFRFINRKIAHGNYKSKQAPETLRRRPRKSVNLTGCQY